MVPKQQYCLNLSIMVLFLNRKLWRPNRFFCKKDGKQAKNSVANMKDLV